MAELLPPSSSRSRHGLGALLTAMRAGATGPGQADFQVDGARILAEWDRGQARLTCPLLERAPDEDELRDIMRKYLRHIDDGEDVLCIGADGRLLLTAGLPMRGSAEPALAAFFDAAVHWRAAVQHRRGTPALFVPPPSFILP